jgi:hypothetical protein
MRILRPVSAAQGLNEADDLPALLEARIQHWEINNMGEEGIRRDYNVTAGNKNAKRPTREFVKKRPKGRAIGIIQNRESWERASLAAVKRRRNAPHTAASRSQLCLFRVGVFLQPIRGVRHNRMDRVLWTRIHPLDCIAKTKLKLPN